MARSGEEALREILHREFALILLDVQMAGMNGFETAALHQAAPAQPPHPDHLHHRGQPRRRARVPRLLARRGRLPGQAVRRRHPALEGGGVHRALRQGREAQAPGAPAARARTRGARAQEPGALPPPARRHAPVHLGGGRRRPRQLLEPRRPRLLRPRAATTVAGRVVLGVPAPGGSRRGPRGTGKPGCAAARRSSARCGSSAPPTAATAGTSRARSPSATPDGTIVGWIATATDIDDQKRAEEALRKAIVLRDDFLSVASHELRTPLTSLKLEVANLSRLAPPRRHRRARPRLMAKVEKIDSQAARLHRLIDELLDVSRIAAGRLELHVEDGRPRPGRQRGGHPLHRRGRARRLAR